MLHALAVAAWVPAAPGKQALWYGARQLRSCAASLPLRPRLCPSPHMQAGSAREARTGSAAAASVDALVDELSEVVATHARSPLTPSELHRSLQTLTAKAAATLESDGAAPRSASVAARRTVAELKSELKARGLPTSGLKVRTALAVRCKGTTARVHSASTYYLLTTCRSNPKAAPNPNPNPHPHPSPTPNPYAKAELVARLAAAAPSEVGDTISEEDPVLASTLRSAPDPNPTLTATLTLAPTLSPYLNP